MAVIDRRRVKQIRTDVVVVHRRKGRERVRSASDRALGYPGHWAVLCGRYIVYGVNTTTKDEEVTCMHCLKRMS